MPFTCEESLRQSFLQHAAPTLWSRMRERTHERTILESTCSEGRADWVWAGVSCDWPSGVPMECSRLLQQPTCSRILATLKSGVVRTESILWERSGVAWESFRRWLCELRDVGLVCEPEDGRYVLGPSFSIPNIEICSFEFKLHNWKRAFYQAKRYRTFSHRVYVVMPPNVAKCVEASLEFFRTFNVGFITHDVDGRSERLLRSKKREPHSRPGFIRALGMLLGQEPLNPAMR